MKNLILLSAVLIFTVQAYSQKKIKVEEKSDGGHKALVVTIYEASSSDVEKAWKSEMKKLGAKVSIKSDIFADDAKMKAIGDNTFDVYAKVRKAGDEAVILTVAVDLGGIYMSSGKHGKEYKAMRDLVYKFAVKTTKTAIAGQLKIAEKVLSVIEKEKKALVKDNEKMHKNIKDNEERIKKAKEEIEQTKKDIEKNVKDQEAKTKEIGEKKQIVEKIAAKEKAVN